MMLPNSHELRYYHLWMLTLVAGVLALVHSPLFAPPAAGGMPQRRASSSLAEPRALRQAAHGFILVVLASVVLATGARYASTVGPHWHTVGGFTDGVVDALPAGATLCIANRDRAAIF